MRTQEAFNQAMEELKSYHRRHQRAVWLVPLKDKYAISIVKPTPKDLPEGTAAVLYAPDLSVVETVQSKRER